MASIFKRGYEAVREERQRQEELKEKRQAMLWKFFLTNDGDEAEVIFLTEEPITFYEHTHREVRNGKEIFTTTTCTGADCRDCDNGDRPSFKGAYLIVDRREREVKDQSTGKKKIIKDQVKLFVQATRVLSQLDRISNKYGLTNKIINVVRLGTGANTTYTFEIGDKINLSSKQIEQLLPEPLREKYDGTMESLYTIVEEQIAANVSDNDYSHDDDEDEEELETRAKDGLISVDDEEEDEEEEYVPHSKKSRLFKESSSKKVSKSSSVKKLKKSRDYDEEDD